MIWPKGSSAPTTHLVISVLDMAAFYQYHSPSFQSPPPLLFFYIGFFFPTFNNSLIPLSLYRPFWAQGKTHMISSPGIKPHFSVCSLFLFGCPKKFCSDQMYFYVMTKGIWPELTQIYFRENKHIMTVCVQSELHVISFYVNTFRKKVQSCHGVVNWTYKSPKWYLIYP